MKFLILLSFCFFAGFANAQFPGWGPQSKVLTDSLSSKALGGAYRAYSIYLPKSYDSDQGKQYPILYLLHGMMGNNESWFNDQKAKDVMDQLVASGEACEMIIVSPNAGGMFMPEPGTDTSICRVGPTRISFLRSLSLMLRKSTG